MRLLTFFCGYVFFNIHIFDIKSVGIEDYTSFTDNAANLEKCASTPNNTFIAQKSINLTGLSNYSETCCSRMLSPNTLWIKYRKYFVLALTSLSLVLSANLHSLWRNVSYLLFHFGGYRSEGQIIEALDYLLIKLSMYITLPVAMVLLFRFGARKTILIGLFMSTLLWVLMSICSAYELSSYIYSTILLLLSGSMVPIFLGFLSVLFLFPKNETLITSILIASTMASSGIFPILKLLCGNAACSKQMMLSFNLWYIVIGLGIPALISYSLFSNNTVQYEFFKKLCFKDFIEKSDDINDLDNTIVNKLQVSGNSDIADVSTVNHGTIDIIENTSTLSKRLPKRIAPSFYYTILVIVFQHLLHEYYNISNASRWPQADGFYHVTPHLAFIPCLLMGFASRKINATSLLITTNVFAVLTSFFLLFNTDIGNILSSFCYVIFHGTFLMSHVAYLYAKYLEYRVLRLFIYLFLASGMSTALISCLIHELHTALRFPVFYMDCLFMLIGIFGTFLLRISRYKKFPMPAHVYNYPNTSFDVINESVKIPTVLENTV